MKTESYKSRILKEFCSLYLWVIVAAVLFLTLVQMGSFADDPGLGWHLKTGEFISNQLRVPKVDPFLATSSPRSWICDQWLSDLILFRIYSFGGWPLLYAVCCSVFLLTFFFLQYRGLKEISNSVLASALIVFVAMKFATVHFILRPVIFSFPLFTFVYLECLKLYRSRNSPKNFGPTYVILPLVFLLWANLHPSFVLGLVLLGLLVLSPVVDRFFGGETDISPKFVERAALLALLCLSVTFVNPNGIDLHRSILWLSQSQFFLNLNSEWQSLDLQAPEGQLFVGAIFAVVAFLFVVGRKSSNLSAFQISSLLGFSYATLCSVRFLPYSGIVLAPILAVLAVKFGETHFFTSYQAARKIRNLLVSWESLIKDSRLGSLVLMGFILFSLCFSYWGGSMPLYQGGYGPSPKIYPYGVIKYLHSVSEKDEDRIPILNHPNWGGFLTFEGAGFLRPVIDDRNTLLGEKPYRDFLDRLKPESDWEAYIHTLHPKYVLLPKGHPMLSSLQQSSEFTSVYRDDIAELFVLG